jgi:selenocysteine-specific elongation factor
MIENILKDHFNKKDEITITEFKKMTSTSRKHAIPLLEFLDRIQVTERKGNNRVKGINFEK